MDKESVFTQGYGVLLVAPSMATSIGLQRSASSANALGAPGRVPNLPVIEHPMSRMGDRGDLSVRGSATVGPRGVAGLQRSQTDVGFRHGRTDGSDLRKSTPERILNWPPGNYLAEFI